MTTFEYNRCVELWSDDIYSFAYHCHCDTCDCEDAVQEAYAALWKNRDDIRYEKAKSYLLSVAYRQMMNRLRSKAITIKNQNLMQPADTYQPAENAELKETLELAMEQLPEIQRAILQLRDIEGYHYKEIADTLNINEQQVQVYLYRARLNMRKQLNKSEL